MLPALQCWAWALLVVRLALRQGQQMGWTATRLASGGGATASELSPVVAGGTPASGSAPAVTVVQASPEVQCCICRGHLHRSEALPVKGNYICLGCGTEVLEQLRRFQNEA